MKKVHQSPAKVLLGDALYTNSKYSLNFVNTRVLKARLQAIESSRPGSSKLKDQESNFLRELNEEIKKVNNVCTKVVLEIDESLRFLSRKLSERVFAQPQDLAATESECNSLLVEITQLEHYTTMSHDSLVAIMKKHDTIVGVVSSAWFDSRLQQEYFTHIPFQKFLLSLSNLFSKIRALKPTERKLPIAETQNGPSVKQYFCREEDYIKVQAWVMKHMYLSRGYAGKLIEDDSFAEDPSIDVTSIYLDGSNFQLFNNFLHCVEGARLVRVSWDGEDKNNCRLSFQSHSGFSDTISIKWKFIGPFLKGEWDFKSYAAKLQKKGKVDQDTTEAFIKSAEALLSVVQEKQLRSILRVHLSRYEYENEDQSAEIRLDGWVEMTKETSAHRDLSKHVMPTKGRERTKLPICVLKVTTDHQLPWISELVQVGLLFAVPSTGHPFDHFLYGVAKLYKSQLDRAIPPSWLQDIEVLAHRHLENITHLTSLSVDMSASCSDDETTDDEDEIKLSTSHDALQRKRSSQTLLASPIKSINRGAPREKNSLERAPAPIPPPFSKSGSEKTDKELEPVRPPVRVEPKTFFSNERTLLQWINAIVALATVAVALIGLGDVNSRTSGFILLPVAILFGFYSLGVFHFRLKAIKERSDSMAFQDHVGPYAIVLVFILALLLSAFLPYAISGQKTSHQFPMIPGDLDHDPDFYEFSTALPLASFVENRTAAVLHAYELLKTTGVPLSYFLSHQPAIPQHWHSNRYITKTPVDKYFSITTDVQDTETGPQSALNVKIFSTLPKFVSLKEPKVKGAGKIRYVLNSNCLNTSFYHQSIAYDAPVIHTLEDVDARVNHLDNNLNISLNQTLYQEPYVTLPNTEPPPTVNCGASTSSCRCLLPFSQGPLTVSHVLLRDEFTLVWRWDSVIAHAISSTAIEIKYPTDPNNVQKNPVPSRADLIIRFSRKYATATSFQSARDLLTAFIPQIWTPQGWPNQNC